MRNATVTTIAPTGSIGVIADCSSGIEPIFALIYKRNVSDSMGKSFIEINKVVKDLLIEKGYTVEKIVKQIEEQGYLELPVTFEHIEIANDISPIDHIRMQAAFQKYVDNAVSKTINLPHDATIHDIEKIYIEAYKQGCKGITLYRNGSRDDQLLTSIESKKCSTGICEL